MTFPASHHRLAKWCLALGAIACASTGVATWSLLASRDPTSDLYTDPALREQAIDELIALAGGGYDSFADPDVGRVMQPRLTDYSPNSQLEPYSTNSFGLRGAEIAIPKPPGTWRLVLLGDSFVFGIGVARDFMVSTILQQQLAERSTSAHLIEVIPIGIPSWNVHAACSYMRRFAHAIEPDAVLHITVRNDLNDNTGIRGFGAMSTFSDAVRERADGIVHLNYPREVLGARQISWLTAGLDWESLSRYSSSAREIARLDSTLSELGASYHLVLYWSSDVGMAFRHLPPDNLRTRDGVLVFPPSFCRDEAIRISKTDPHWNPKGANRVAEILYGYLDSEEVLSPLNASPQDDARASYETIHRRGIEQAEERRAIARAEGKISSRLTFGELSDSDKAQVHGGVERNGFAHPYASLILANEGTRIRISADRLGKPGISGSVSVFCDEHRIGGFDLAGSDPVTLEANVPSDCAENAYVSIRFVATDYLYDSRFGALCRCFRLRSAETHDG